MSLIVKCPDCGELSLVRVHAGELEGLVVCIREECGYERQGNRAHDLLARERGEAVPS